MLNFSYTGRDQQGSVVKGHFQAPTAEDVAQELIAHGIIPIKIDLEKANQASFKKIFKKALQRRKTSTNDLIVFCQQMYTFYKAGIPIVAGLKNIVDSSANKHLTIVLKKVMTDLEAGYSFANSLAKHPAYFPDILVNIVEVGETSGQLDIALLQVSEYLEMQDNTTKQIKSAARYPILVIVFVCVALVILNICVIPVFAKIFAGFNAQLPLMTRILMGVSSFFVNYWLLLACAVLLNYILILYTINTPKGRYVWDGLKLKMPISGKIIQRVLFARLARCFALIIRTNVLISRGIELTADAADNAYVREHLLSARAGLTQGESILSVVKKTTLFPPFILQMLSVGEQTGAMDSMLIYVATYYEREISFQLKRANDLMEPILLFFIGIIVLILALGIFLPMWDLPNIVLRR